MAPKRQIGKADKFANSHAVASGANFKDPSLVSHSASKRQRVEALFDNDGIPENHPRRSSRAGKGSGGQLEQLHQLERVQLAKHSRSSVRDLEIATQGHETNPMAPSYEQPPEDQDEESQVSPKVVSATQAKPSFTHAQPGDNFGFRLPKQAAVVSTRDTEVGAVGSRSNLGPSSVLSSKSHQSSRSSSMFSQAMSRRTSTPITSRAPSECLDQDTSNLRHASQRSFPIVRDVEEACVTHNRRANSSAQFPSFPSGDTIMIDEASPSKDERFAEWNLRKPVSNPQRFQGAVSTYDNGEHPASSAVATGFQYDKGPCPVLYQGTAHSRDSADAGIHDDGVHPDSGTIATRTQPEESLDPAFRRGIAHSRDRADGAAQDSHYHNEPLGRVIVTGTRRDQGSGSVFRRGAAHSRDQADGADQDVHDDDELLDPATTTGTRRAQGSGSVFRRDSHNRVPVDTGSNSISVRGAVQVQNRDRARVGTIRAHNNDEHLDTSAVTNARHTQGSSVVSHRSEAEDIVVQHRQRNRAPRLPSNGSLQAIRDVQRAQLSRRGGSGGSVPNDNDELDTPISASLQHPSDDPLSASSTWTPPNVNTNPSQLHFYPPPVRDIIERAKQFSHCDLASINAFPLHPQFNVKATDYVNEAITERRSQGLTIPSGWWPDYADGIAKLLWEDVGNWRSAVKKKARNSTRERYQWDPQNRRSANADIARDLLNGGTFLKDGVDADGHTNNLAHPALSGLVIDFFYTGQTSVGNLFPEVFARDVPRPTVALAATAIKNVLDEIAADGKEVAFKRDVYADVYVDVLGLMAKCDTSPVHQAKTAAQRKQWAKIGVNGNGATGNSTGFDVDLD